MNFSVLFFPKGFDDVKVVQAKRPRGISCCQLLVKFIYFMLVKHTLTHTCTRLVFDKVRILEKKRKIRLDQEVSGANDYNCGRVDEVFSVYHMLNGR